MFTDYDADLTCQINQPLPDSLILVKARPVSKQNGLSILAADWLAYHPLKGRPAPLNKRLNRLLHHHHRLINNLIAAANDQIREGFKVHILVDDVADAAIDILIAGQL